jgi:hypothetical protein
MCESQAMDKKDILSRSRDIKVVIVTQLEELGNMQ